MINITQEEVKRVKAQGFLFNRNQDFFSARVITKNGVVNAQQMQTITQAAEKFGNGHMAFTSRLTVEIQGVPYENIQPLQDFLAQYGLKTGGTGAKVRPVVACKGTVCVYGKIDTQGIAKEFHERFFEGYSKVALPHKFKIAVGGCPNNCVKPDLNDFGIVGQCVPNFQEEICRGCKKCAIETLCPAKAAKLENGKMHINSETCFHCGRCVGKCPFKAIEDGTIGYKVYIGGRWGKFTRHGTPINKIFTNKEEVLDLLEKTILYYKENGQKGERLATMVDRIGIEEVERALLGDALLRRKEEILSKE